MVRRIRAKTGFALTVIVIALAALPTRAENDSLASDFGSFGAGGIVADAPLEINDVALLPDGKIIAVGTKDNTFAVARYNANGVLDQTFGTGGLVVTPVSDTQQRAEATGVVVQPDGQSVVVGTVYRPGGSDFAVVRYSAEGAPDANFGGDGTLTVDFDGGDDSAAAVALDGDNRIVVGGAAVLGGQRNFAALRLAINGTLDATFDGNGKTTVDFGGNAFAVDLLIQPGGQIVLAGQADVAMTDDKPGLLFALARLLPNGTRDPTFDDDGRLFDRFTDDDVASKVALDGNGKIVVAGAGTGGTLIVARYNPHGTPDDSFNDDGRAITPVGSAAATAYDVIALPYNGILVAGRSDGQLAFVGYTPDRALDTYFDGDGKLFVEFDQRASAAARSLVRVHDGRLLVAGGPFMARLFYDGTLDAGGRQLTVFERATITSGAVRTLVQPDGKIVSVGHVEYSDFTTALALTRHLPNGELDPLFGNAGTLTLGYGKSYVFSASALLQPDDGKIVIVGTAQQNPQEDRDVLIGRLNSDGSPDQTCGEAGLTPLDVGGGIDDQPSAVALQADGKLLVAGTIRYSMGERAFVLRLESPCGLPDPSFGEGGVVELASATGVTELLALPDGKIQLVGAMEAGVVLASFNADGSPDDTFGTSGKVVTPLERGVTGPAAALPDGKLLVAAAQYANEKLATLLLRYTATGELDARFGQEGVVIVDLGPNGQPSALALRGDGAIALTGCFDSGIGAPVALFSAEGMLDPSFGDGGKTNFTAGGFTCLRDAVFSGERLIVGGFAVNASRFSFALAAFSVGGAPRTLGFAPAAATVPESIPAATLTVRLSQTTAHNVTVQYAVTGGTATNGSDYTLAAGTLTFATGQTSQRIAVPLTDDADDEVDEIVVVALSDPSNAILGSSASFTLMIADDDPTPPGSPPASNSRVFLPLVRR